MEHIIFLYSYQGDLKDIKSLYINDNDDIKSLLYNFTPNKIYKKVGESFYNTLNQIEKKEIEDDNFPKEIIVQSKY